MDALLLIFFVCFLGDNRYEPIPRILGEESFEQKLEVLLPFLSDQKYWRELGPLTNPISANIVLSKF